ncbi:hypothetical protein [Rhizobium sp. WYCCWR 11146]|uniref:hypothetical protein n=1 Tax=Rhizobium sp. WYCCWR 11146 TaxID=2749833 RepID=UPI0015E70FF4|nr:hypothetical protein [Rhizobium sp. WYCCWR 11146]MBA1343915.1 hypothetical protein [Rhizobium sp. WYCCWR 11146]
MPHIKEISTRNEPLVMQNIHIEEQGSSCNGAGRLIQLRSGVVHPANVIIGEVNVRTGKRNLISQTYQKGETVVGCSLLPNGEGISRQVNWAYGDTNYFPANVDDPYDSVVIVFNPATGNRFVYNLHARNATISVLRENGKYYQYILGDSGVQGIALNPGETVAYVGWNAAVVEHATASPRRKELIEIATEKTVAVADRIEIREVDGPSEKEHVLSVNTPEAVNLIIYTLETDSQHYTRLTAQPGVHVLGPTKDSAGLPVGRRIAWAYGDTNYFPRDVWDGFEAVIAVRDPTSKGRALWNLAPNTTARVLYWDDIEKESKEVMIEGGLFFPLQEGDIVSLITMAAW